MLFFKNRHVHDWVYGSTIPSPKPHDVNHRYIKRKRVCVDCQAREVLLSYNCLQEEWMSVVEAEDFLEKIKADTLFKLINEEIRKNKLSKEDIKFLKEGEECR